MRTSTACLLTAAFVLACAAIHAEDWTALHGSDPACTGDAPGEEIRLPLEPLWTFETGGRVRSSAAIVNGVAYIGSCDGNIYAIDAASGEELWRQETGAEVYSSPAVADGLVFVGSRDGNIYALDVKTGKPAWKHEVGRPVRSSGIIVEGVLYIGSGELCFEGGRDEQELPNLWALDAKTGKVLWQYNCGGIWSRPAVADGVVYIASMGGFLSAVDAASGREIWIINTWGAPIWSAPVIYQKSLFMGSIDKNMKQIYVLDVESARWRWIANSTGPAEATMCISGDVVYYSGGTRGVTALDLSRIDPDVKTTAAELPAKGGWIPKTHPLALRYSYGRPLSSEARRVFGSGGEEGSLERVRKWHSNVGKVRAGIVTDGAHLWVSDQGMATGKGRLLALTLDDGSVAWEYTLGGECWSTPALSDGRVLVGCDDGKVYCFGQ